MPLFQQNFSKCLRMSVFEILRADFTNGEAGSITYRMIHLYLHRGQKWKGIVERNCWTQPEFPPRAPCTNALYKWKKTEWTSIGWWLKNSEIKLCSIRELAVGLEAFQQNAPQTWGRNRKSRNLSSTQSQRELEFFSLGFQKHQK